MRKQMRGFAVLSPEKLREISSKGGKAVQRKGSGHRWTSETAKLAGRKGGLAVRPFQDEQEEPPAA